VYWSFGQNLIDMMEIAERNSAGTSSVSGMSSRRGAGSPATVAARRDHRFRGVRPDEVRFNYDSQEFVYQEVRAARQRDGAPAQRTDGAVDAAYLARTDRIYNGDRTKWLKFAHGLRDQPEPLLQQGVVRPGGVIAAVDNVVHEQRRRRAAAYPATSTTTRNFWGRTRGNNLELPADAVRGRADERHAVRWRRRPAMTRMLSPSPDGEYRGLDPNVVGFGALAVNAAAQQPVRLSGRRRLCSSRPVPVRRQGAMPAMTYAQLQFIKAEAAYRMGDRRWRWRRTATASRRTSTS
jgi:hypothetical protein